MKKRTQGQIVLGAFQTEEVENEQITFFFFVCVYILPVII